VSRPCCGQGCSSCYRRLLQETPLSPVWTGREPIPCARKSFTHNLIGIIKDDEERSSS
jgi:hypothetical protein